MLNKLYCSIADVLLRRDIIEKDDYDVIVYGLDNVIYTFLSLGGIVLLGVIFGLFKETVVYLAVQLPLQLMGGSFHARTHLKCFALMVAVWFVFAAAYTFLPYIAIASLSAVGCLLIWIVAPIENVNAPLSKKQKRNGWIFVRIYAPIMLALGIFICKTNMALGTATLLAVAISGFSMLAGYFSKDRVR